MDSEAGDQCVKIIKFNFEKALSAVVNLGQIFVVICSILFSRFFSSLV